MKQQYWLPLAIALMATTILMLTVTIVLLSNRLDAHNESLDITREAAQWVINGIPECK